MPRPDPFSSSSPPEVPLARPPLPLVILQLKFPVVAALAKLDAIAPFQQALSKHYPILRAEQASAIVVGPQGVQIQAGEGKIWRFADKANAWRVSLTTEFVAIETRSYVSRQDFVSRLATVLQALQQTAAPAVYERLGFRFVNRLKGPDVEALPELVRPEVLGITGSKFSAKIVHSLCETSFAVGDDGLTARWGLLPPGGTPDPGAIEPINEPTWLLDMDAFSTKASDFSVEAVAAKTTMFGERLYSFFRWAVTDEFLTRFGGAR